MNGDGTHTVDFDVAVRANVAKSVQIVANGQYGGNAEGFRLRITLLIVVVKNGFQHFAMQCQLQMGVSGNVLLINRSALFPMIPTDVSTEPCVVKKGGGKQGIDSGGAELNSLRSCRGYQLLAVLPNAPVMPVVVGGYMAGGEH